MNKNDLDKINDLFCKLDGVTDDDFTLWLELRRKYKNMIAANKITATSTEKEQ